MAASISFQRLRRTCIGFTLLAGLGLPQATIAATICALGPPSDALTSEVRAMRECLSLLSRYDGKPDADGRVYGRYGEVLLAVDSAGAYRYYEDSDSWVRFAGAEGWAPTAMRDIAPPQKDAAVAATSEPPMADLKDPPATPEVPLDDPQPASKTFTEAPPAQAAAASTDLLIKETGADEAPTMHAAPAAAPEGGLAADIAATADAAAVAQQAPQEPKAPRLPIIRRDPSGNREVDFVDAGKVADEQDQTVFLCQFRGRDGWQSSNDYSLEACAARVRTAHQQGDDPATPTSGYWNGIYIAVWHDATYISRSAGKAWTAHPETQEAEAGEAQ